LPVLHALGAQAREPEPYFAEWASVYRTWLARPTTYRDEIHRVQRSGPSLDGLVRVAS
jgi:hypothetical protein